MSTHWKAVGNLHCIILLVYIYLWRVVSYYRSGSTSLFSHTPCCSHFSKLCCVIYIILFRLRSCPHACISAFSLGFPLWGQEDLQAVPLVGSLLSLKPQLKYCHPHVAFPNLQYRETSLSFVICFMPHAMSVLSVKNLFIYLFSYLWLFPRVEGFSVFFITLSSELRVVFDAKNFLGQ